MKKYVKVYLDYFGYGKEDMIICECCREETVVDIHHIKARGMGGSKFRDDIENLIGLGRKCHDRAEGKVLPKITKTKLKTIVENR